MRRIFLSLIVLCAQAAYGYEYRLQFTPAGGYQGLVVAGYEFNGETVVGNCSYYVTTSGGGRGAHVVRTNHYSTCVWDVYGNLISMTPGAPAVPLPLSQTGTEVVYAVSGSSSTGHDTRGFGFVNTPAAHYSWQTMSSSAVIPYTAYTITATLISDGDLALQFDGAKVLAEISGTITPSPGTAKIAATTCKSELAVGATCSVTVFYNPTTIKCTPSPYGYAYTKIDLSLVTDAGAVADFTETFTVTGVPICDD
jgi:hypothetical protein